MFGHSLLPVRSGGRLLLGGAVCVTVVVDSSMSMPFRVYFVNLRLTIAVFRLLSESKNLKGRKTAHANLKTTK